MSKAKPILAFSGSISVTTKEAFKVIDTMSGVKIGKRSVTLWRFDQNPPSEVRSHVRRRVGESMEQMIVRAVAALTSRPLFNPIEQQVAKSVACKGCGTRNGPIRFINAKAGSLCDKCIHFMRMPAHDDMGKAQYRERQTEEP